MKIKAIFFFAISAIFCCSASYAQELNFSIRDAMMLMAVEQLAERKQPPAGDIPLSSRDEVISSAINHLEDSEHEFEKLIKEPQAPEPKAGKRKTPGIGLINSYLKRITSRLHPYVSAQANFNDNVDNLRKKRSSLDYSTTTGIKGSYTARGGRSFYIDAFMKNVYYERNAAANTQDLTVNTHFNFGIKRNTFSIANSYFTNYIDDESFGVKPAQQEHYWSDALSLSWGRHFNRIGFDVGGAHSESRYEDTYKTEDVISDSFGIAQYLFMGRKTRLSLGYYYKRSKYEWAPGNDSRTDTFSLELAGVVSPKITGAFSVGYGLLDVKTGRDIRTKDFGLGFAYRISNRTNLSVDLTHSIQNDSGVVTNYSTQDSFSLSGKHRLAFNPRLSLSFSTNVLYADYPKMAGSGNDYKNYDVGLGLGYAFRQWLDLSLNWVHARRYSNIATNYNKNTVVFVSSARF